METYDWIRIDTMSHVTNIQVYHLGAIRENRAPYMIMLVKSVLTITGT